MNLRLLFIILIFACGNSNDQYANKQSTTAAYPPVETEKPNTDYTPAFSGQTRIQGIKTQNDFSVSVITDKLDRPWGICVLPDGRFLITEKKGNMRIVNSSGVLSDKINGLPEVNANAQGGLLGLTIDPAFSQNRMVYFTFSEESQNGNLTAVAKGKLSSDEKSLENVKVIYRATPAYKSELHYGGRIIFDKDGNLFVSTGERSDIVTRPQAQSLNSSLGKILHLTKEGKAVAGSPFNKQNERAEIYSYGHRNVQSLAIHPETGELWEAEFGPKGGDELNIIKAGKNYGWPVITYGLEYDGRKINNGLTQKEGMEQPVYYWDPVLSPSGMTFYTGNTMKEWKNDLFICGLNSNHIARIKIVNNKVSGEERLLTDQKQRFRDICNGKDGALYTVTDEGKLIRFGQNKLK